MQIIHKFFNILRKQKKTYLLNTPTLLLIEFCKYLKLDVQLLSNSNVDDFYFDVAGVKNIRSYFDTNYVKL